MAKASPAKRSFNAGEFSILVEGRTDVDKYASSMRRILNAIAAPQGPFMRRSGTYFTCENYDKSSKSTLVPFVFSDTEALNLEFCHGRLRFIFETGVQTYTPVAVTAIVSYTSGQIVFTSAALVAAGIANGDQVALAALPGTFNANTRVASVTNVAGNNVTINMPNTSPVVGAVTATAAKVYHITTPYANDDAQNLRAVQDQDVVYLFCKGYQPRVLSRLSAYNWTLSFKSFNLGPFINEDALFGGMTISATGRAVPNSSAASAGTAANGFDGDQNTMWDSGAAQTGWLEGTFTVPAVLNGYVIYCGLTNSDATYAAADYAPSTWTFEGWTGAAWVVLDTQREYILYEGGRSGWFQINNTVAYGKYRINVTKAKRNGTPTIRIAELVFTSPTPAAITVTIPNTSSLNASAGFLSTDVGRLLRVRSSDGQYRVLKITAYTSKTQVTTALQTEPFLDTAFVSQWAPGYLSDTTGWPTCATFFEDRLWCAGIDSFPGLVLGSRSGNYDSFETKTSQDEVLDDSAVAVQIKSRKVSNVRWLETDERGLLLGTGTGEFVISAANPDNATTARNIKGRASTARGSAAIEPVKVDRNIVHVHVSRRSAREYSYSFQSDGYTSRSLTLFASHLGIPQFAQLVYAAEPHSIIWFRRDDGSVVGLTYNKEEDVIGWHTHTFSGVVESLSVTPSAVDIQDTLWMVIRRTLPSGDVRYIERLTRFWDFDSTVQNAHFVDSGLKYSGPAINDLLYGLTHLEGKLVDGVLNGIPYKGMLVTNGTIALPIPDVTTAVVGLPFETFGEISRMDAGGTDGTAMGKKQRANVVSPHLWDTFYGEIGRWNAEDGLYEFERIVYKEAFDELTPIALQTEILEPINLPPGYNNRGTLAFRQTDPLPFNLIALYPQLETT